MQPKNDLKLNKESTMVLLSEIQAAKKLGVSRITMIRLRNRNEIGHFRIGTRILYSEKHLEVFLSQVERKPKKIG